MGVIAHWRTHAVLPAAMLLALSAPLLAEPQESPHESPPTFEAGKLKGIKRAGENYNIRNPVRSDGLYRIYTLRTPYGDFTVPGDQMLRMRINELAALAQLEKISQSEQFSKALLLAGLSPLTYAGKLIADPARTLHDTFAGVGTFLDSVGAGAAHAGKTQDDMAAGLLGISKERRQLAARLGVDPYTDFAPLAAKLTQLSEAAALGGLAVTGAMFTIPGTAGIVVTNLSTANTLGDLRIDELARGYTASQIFELNRQRLAAMGVDPALIESLLTNRRYTPIDLAVLVASLDSMSGVGNRALFVRRAAAANGRAQAYGIRRHAEMVAAAHRGGAFVRFVLLGGLSFNQTRDGAIVGAMPVDALAWTAATSKAAGDAAADLGRVAPGGSVELRITGSATGLARQRLEGLGWRLVEDSKL